MKKNLFKKTNIKENNINFLGEKISTKAYESKIKKARGIDVQILGIGRNAHIGFNEPGSSFKSKTRKIKISKTTREDNSRFFDSIDEVPKYAWTMGIKTILQAKKIILLATGKHKANAVAKAMEGKQTTKVPASALQTHKDVTFILDEAAASRLREI